MSCLHPTWLNLTKRHTCAVNKPVTWPLPITTNWTSVNKITGFDIYNAPFKEASKYAYLETVDAIIPRYVSGCITVSNIVFLNVSEYMDITAGKAFLFIILLGMMGFVNAFPYRIYVVLRQYIIQLNDAGNRGNLSREKHLYRPLLCVLTTF